MGGGEAKNWKFLMGEAPTACSHPTNKEREAMARESAGAPALDLENYKKFYGFGIPK
jgi:hypothetical protein